MFPRRRSSARQVHVGLPRGHQLEVTLPRPPWDRQPARSPWARPQAIAAMVAGALAGVFYLAGRMVRRRSTSEPELAARPDDTAGQSTISPATQPATSDREPDEIDGLAKLDSSNRHAHTPR
jgi:hypothetical protein